MNEELIRKLHDQAWGETHEKAIAVTETPIDFQKVLRERFAELIVRECMNVAVYKSDGMIFTADIAGHQAAGREIAAKMIKQHFGVE